MFYSVVWERSILPAPCSPLCTPFLGGAPEGQTHRHSPVSDCFLYPLSGLILYSLSFFLFFVYLFSFCLRHFSLTSVFTRYQSVLSCIGGPQVLLSTWIDEGRTCPWLPSVNTVLGLTPDLHWCDWQLKYSQLEAFNRKSGLVLQRI